jgi:hypothetical protein
MASDLLTVVRSEIEVRLLELRPLMSEYERLAAAAEALGFERDGAPSSSVRAKVPAAPRESPTQPEITPAADEQAPVAQTRPPRRAGSPRAGARARRGSAAGAIEQASSGPRTPRAPRTSAPAAPRTSAPAKARKGAPAVRSAVGQAIVAALEHGSHTPAELTVVTAMSGPDIQGGLRRLLREGTIAKTERDGKTAYALPAA